MTLQLRESMAAQIDALSRAHLEDKRLAKQKTLEAVAANRRK